MRKILDILWKIGVPILATVWTVAQIINWNHNVDTSGSPFFAFLMVFLGVLTLTFYILHITGGPDPVRLVYDGIMWVVNKFKKKKE
jgi:hypothetical protein